MTEPGEVEIERGARLPGWAMGVITALMVGAIGTGAAVLLDTRTGQARLEERVGQLERDQGANAGVPAQIAVLVSRVEALTNEVARLNNKLDERKR